MEKMINIRKLAALDMILNGKWLILVEFITGTLGSFALAYFSYSIESIGRIPLTVFFIGIGANYMPLSLYAIYFVIRDNYEAVAKDVQTISAKKKYSYQQLLILIPFLILIVSVFQAPNNKKE